MELHQVHLIQLQQFSLPWLIKHQCLANNHPSILRTKDDLYNWFQKLQFLEPTENSLPLDHHLAQDYCRCHMANNFLEFDSSWSLHWEFYWWFLQQPFWKSHYTWLHRDEHAIYVRDSSGKIQLRRLFRLITYWWLEN